MVGSRELKEEGNLGTHEVLTTLKSKQASK